MEQKFKYVNQIRNSDIMNKGLTTRTIILIILGLIVLGLATMLIFLGVGPFQKATSYEICRTRLIAYCAGTGTWETDKGCAGVTFSGHKAFCGEGSCYKGESCSAVTDDSKIHCCNVFGI